MPVRMNGAPFIRTGMQTFGSRASQYDILDITNHVTTTYSVDTSRIYLVGHSMGGLTALLTAARWPHVFAGVVSDSGPTDLTQWYADTYASSPPGITPNGGINSAIQAETGAFEAAGHTLVAYRDPSRYGFEYSRRSPQEFALNFRHLPLLLNHMQSDTRVDPHFAWDMYYKVAYNSPDKLDLRWFPGNHDAPLAGRVEGILDWLSTLRRQPNDAPQNNTFTLDESGRVF